VHLYAQAATADPGQPGIPLALSDGMDKVLRASRLRPQRPRSCASSREPRRRPWWARSTTTLTA
jgi:hypothetical protein